MLKLSIINGKGDFDTQTGAGEDDWERLATDFLSGEGGGVVKQGDFLVEEQASPGMAVDVAPGVCYIPNAAYAENTFEAKYYRAISDDTEAINISSNPSGQTRFDIIVVRKTADPPGDDGDNVEVEVVEGTPGSGVPATPSNVCKLAEIEVGDGATSITNAEITNVAPIVHWKTGQGWDPVAESWTFNAWTAATRIGVITVPAGATSKYSPGMRVRISQATGGTKHGIIHKVEATKLTVFVEADKTLENETISNPHYSTQKVPFGFPLEASVWSLEDTQTQPSDIYTFGSYVSDLVDVTIGVGRWSIYYQTEPRARDTAESGPIIVRAGLNTTSNTSTPLARYRAGHVGRATGGTSEKHGVGGSITIIDEITVTSGTVTYYGTCRADGIANQLRRAPHGHTVLRLTSAFL